MGDRTQVSVSVTKKDGRSNAQTTAMRLIEKGDYPLKPRRKLAAMAWTCTSCHLFTFDMALKK